MSGSIKTVLIVFCMFSYFSKAASADDKFFLDFRYAPPYWQTSICLKDDWQKTLVAKDGTLLYDFNAKGPGKNFATRISIDIDDSTSWKGQELYSPRVPLVITHSRKSNLELTLEAFAAFSGKELLKKTELPDTTRNDIMIARIKNNGASPQTVNPIIKIESLYPVFIDTKDRSIKLGDITGIFITIPYTMTKYENGKVILKGEPLTIKAGGEISFALGVSRGLPIKNIPVNLKEAENLKMSSIKYWENLDLPYGHITVPDKKIQSLLESCIRNIYQAREIKKGLPAFQVGPTCYRGLWVVDGSFILEAVTYLSRASESRPGIEYLMSFQREDGGWLIIPEHWKETGIALWAITHHARLTGDKEWLDKKWTNVEKGVAFIRKMRDMSTMKDPKSNYAGLIPPGMSDGGYWDSYPEYTNIYWNLVGMKAVVDAANWMGKTKEAAEWQKEYDDFYSIFRKAAERDMTKDDFGNLYLPIRMDKDKRELPQKAQWGFMHSVYPGKLFKSDDPLVRGNMVMLKAVEKEGLVYGTGWMSEGIWNYFGSFYAHGWLWIGEGQKAAETMYAFANHASPLLAWREEQFPQGTPKQDPEFGDMPHNWASAEFIRLVRHSIVLERGTELHLFEGLPSAWIYPGAVIKLKDIITEFGPVSLELVVAQDGKTAMLKIDQPSRDIPTGCIIHLDGWSGKNGTISIPASGIVDKTIELNR